MEKGGRGKTFPDGEPAEGTGEFEGVWGEDAVGLGEDFVGRDGVDVDAAAGFGEGAVCGLAGAAERAGAGGVELGV